MVDWLCLSLSSSFGDASGPLLDRSSQSPSGAESIWQFETSLHKSSVCEQLYGPDLLTEPLPLKLETRRDGPEFNNPSRGNGRTYLCFAQHNRATTWMFQVLIILLVIDADWHEDGLSSVFSVHQNPRHNLVELDPVGCQQFS